MKKTIILLLMVAGMFSCATPQYFQDYDRQADFSELQTYDFYAEMETGLSGLDEERVMAAIDSVLQAKGLEKSNAPAFKINFYASYFQTLSQSMLGIGVGSGGGNMGIGISGGIPIGGPETYLNLTVEFVKQPSEVLVWQGVAEAQFDPNMLPAERERYFRELISGLLENYPPGGKK